MIETLSFLNAGGLFDFDFTFFAEAFLFLFFSIIVTSVFLNPISKQLTERSQYINYHIRKSTLYLACSSATFSKTLLFLTKECQELNRQLKVTQNFTKNQFDNEISTVQTFSFQLLKRVKGTLAIQSAFILKQSNKDLLKLTNHFFKEQFLSNYTSATSLF